MRLKLTDDQKWMAYEAIVGLVVFVVACILLYIGSLQNINQANQVSVIFSKPFVEKVDSNEYLVTLEVAVAAPYADHIYVIPFLTSSSSTDPALTFQGASSTKRSFRTTSATLMSRVIMW